MPNRLQPSGVGCTTKSRSIYDQKRFPHLPIILLFPPAQGAFPELKHTLPQGVDHGFIVWDATKTIPAALRFIDDEKSLDQDSSPVVILVEDSLEHASHLLAILHPILDSPVKLILATTHESAMALYKRYAPRVIGLICDTRLPKNGREEAKAGLDILSRVKEQNPSLPLMLTSTEASNKKEAAQHGLPFLDKTRKNLERELKEFIQRELNIQALPPIKRQAPPANSRIKSIGIGAMGGKARGLIFMEELLRAHPELELRYPQMAIQVPRTLVLRTDIFESFIRENQLGDFGGQEIPAIAQAFIDAALPAALVDQLRAFLKEHSSPLAVRPSSLLSDAHVQPTAGTYKTYHIPNNHNKMETRLDHLVTAVKLVFASAYYPRAKAFCKNTTCSPTRDTMAVIIQELAGNAHKDFFYPAMSGRAQSANYYPFSPIKSEDGTLHLSMGLGAGRGKKTLRISPRHPQVIPQLASPDDFLTKTQKSFYALKLEGYPKGLHFALRSNLEKRSLADAVDESPVKILTSTYVADENRVRDTWYCPGPKVLTFAQILKYDAAPIAGLISDLLEWGKAAMAAPVEMEFAATAPKGPNGTWEFSCLQLRPMATRERHARIRITREEMDKAICVSSSTLGHGTYDALKDIVYVKPENFSGSKTREMAMEINHFNAQLSKRNRPYLLAGPGRWGSSDPFLGIPVDWHQISGAGAILEIQNGAIHAEASQGSHFFHKIT
ncbi:MAG: PEP/pyruvate-binding domain-containing protein, partial [Desulfovibrionales bacterium]|nr:PEP/pyruvate-binding domain-containing protein [Desulfovibrionales bacterium]